MEVGWEEGHLRQAATGLEERLEKEEWETGRIVKIAWQNPSLVWPLGSRQTVFLGLGG